jgi:ribosome-associated translation inhibitor RaiA
MSVASNNHGLPVEFDTHQCDLSRAELDRMEDSLGMLRELVAPFPVTELHVLIARNNRSNDFTVKTSLLLLNDRHVASEHHEQAFTAFERCVEKLVREVGAFRDRLEDVEERRKHEQGTHQELMPDQAPNFSHLDRAAREGDYAAFRTAMLPYEEPLRKRVGRWVQRSPNIEAQLGKLFTIADIVECVLLDAFERYEAKPREIAFHEWLANLIDPAVQEVVRHPDRERENISMARSAAGIQPSREERRQLSRTNRRTPSIRVSANS